MSGVEALARVLCRRVSEPGYCDRCEGAAEHALADPGPLLAALAEAGVLRESERLATRMVYDADGGPTDRVVITERRYVTNWTADD